MQRYKISNHLTGVLFFGDTIKSYIETKTNLYLDWNVNKTYGWNTGWDPSFAFGDNIFHILDETEEVIFLENVETGVKFWVSNGGWLEKIPVP